MKTIDSARSRTLRDAVQNLKMWQKRDLWKWLGKETKILIQDENALEQANLDAYWNEQQIIFNRG